VDRDAGGPAGRGIGTALDVAGKQFDAGEQAADAAHVAVAVAANSVAHAFENQRLILERRERLEAFLERELGPLLIGPERAGNHAIGAEYDDEPLLALRRLCGAQ